jgi:hypothetical protein
MLKHKIVFKIGIISTFQKISYYFNSNLSYEEIEDAFNKSENILGFSLKYEVGNRDRNMPEYIVEKLKSVGFDFGIFKPPYSIEAMDYLEIFLFMVKFGNPNFQYEKIEMDEMYIGGKAFIRSSWKN